MTSRRSGMGTTALSGPDRAIGLWRLGRSHPPLPLYRSEVSVEPREQLASDVTEAQGVTGLEGDMSFVFGRRTQQIEERLLCRLTAPRSHSGR